MDIKPPYEINPYVPYSIDDIDPKLRPPAWLIQRWPPLREMGNNPISLLSARQTERSMFYFDPIRILFSVVGAIIFIASLFFLGCIGIIIFAIAIKFIMARLPRTHLNVRLFGIRDNQLIRDLVLTPIEPEVIVWGALTPLLSQRRIRSVLIRLIVCAALFLSIAFLMQVPFELILIQLILACQLIYITVKRIDALEINLLRQVARSVWTRHAGKRKDSVWMIGSSIGSYVLYTVIWMIMCVPSFLILAILTTNSVYRLGGGWSALTGLLISTTITYNIYLYLLYQNENYNVHDIVLLYEDVLRAEAGVESNRNLTIVYWALDDVELEEKNLKHVVDSQNPRPF